MKTTSLSTAVLVTLLSNLGFAGHEPGKYRRLDDLAFGASASARDLRWEIHDDFEDSRDYRYLLRDAETLAEEVRHIMAAIWAERPDAVICREIEAARNALNSMATRLDGCDFAHVDEGYHRTTNFGRRRAFAPPTRHAGYAHVLAARELLARIDASLCAIHDELTGGHLVPFSVNTVNPLPAPEIAPPPSVPFSSTPLPRFRGNSSTHVEPVVPGVTPPRVHETGSRSRSIELPLIGGKNGGLTLRFDN